MKVCFHLRIDLNDMIASDFWLLRVKTSLYLYVKWNFKHIYNLSSNPSAVPIFLKSVLLYFLFFYAVYM